MKSDALVWAYDNKVTSKLLMRRYIKDKYGDLCVLISDAEIETMCSSIRKTFVKSIDQLIDAQFCMYEGHEFVKMIIKRNGSYLVVFGFEKNYEENNANVLLVDGTFHIVPACFTKDYQMLNFMIHVRDTDMYLPILHILMKGKSYTDYKFAFSQARLFINFKKYEYISCDFEISLINSLKELGNGDIRGCYFHFTQCLRRKFISLYSSPNKLQWKAYQVYRILPFLNKKTFDSIVKLLKDNSNEFKKFELYFEKQWVSKYGIIEKFSLKNEIFTNDALESYHRELNAFTNPYNRPTIGEATLIMERIDDDRQMRLRSLRLSGEKIKRKVSYRKTTENIQEIINAFCDEAGIQRFIINQSKTVKHLEDKNKDHDEPDDSSELINLIADNEENNLMKEPETDDNLTKLLDEKATSVDEEDNDVIEEEDSETDLFSSVNRITRILV